MDQPSVVEFPAVSLVCVERQAQMSELPQVIPAGLDAVAAANNGLKLGPPRVYYVNWCEGQGEIWIGFVCETDLEPGEGTMKKDIPGGTAMFARHAGPYNELTRTWDAVLGAAHAHEMPMTGLSWEDYVEPVVPTTDVYVELAACAARAQ